MNNLNKLKNIYEFSSVTYDRSELRIESGRSSVICISKPKHKKKSPIN